MRSSKPTSTVTSITATSISTSPGSRPIFPAQRISRSTSGNRSPRGCLPAGSPVSASGKPRGTSSNTPGPDMTRPFAGQTILVTGASRGIGAVTAALLAKQGARVIRMSRSAMPPMSHTIDLQVDLIDPRARTAAFAQVSEQHGTPDAIVSNAGAFLLAPLAETSDDLVREQIAINLEAPLALARHFLPPMQVRGSGSHVLIGSVADAQGFSGNSAYAASKYGVRGLHEVLTEEFGGSGIRFA